MKTGRFSLKINSISSDSLYLKVTKNALCTDVPQSTDGIEVLKYFIENHIIEFSEAYEDNLLENLKQIFSFLGAGRHENSEENVYTREVYIFRVLMRVFKDGSDQIIRRYAEIFRDLLKSERNHSVIRFEKIFKELSYLEFLGSKIKEDTKNKLIWIELFRCIFQQFFFAPKYLHTLIKKFMMEGGKIPILLLFESPIWRSCLTCKSIAPLLIKENLEIFISLIDESENIKAFLIDVIFLQINS